MDPQAIDLSAGLTPPPAAAAGGIDLSAGLNPAGTPAPPMAPSVSLTQNPNNEGVYQLKGQHGQTVGVPYSKISDATRPGAGYDFANPQEHARYFKDYAADPQQLAATNATANATGSTDAMRVGIGTAKDAAQMPNTLTGWLDSLVMKGKQHAEAAHPGTHYEIQPLRPQLEALENKVAPGITDPLQGGAEHVGAIGDQLAQWMTGEGLLKAGMSLAEKTAAIAKMMQTLEKTPALAKAVSFAMKAAGAGAGAGAQQLAHGESADTAETAAMFGAGSAAAGDAAIGGAKAMFRKIAKPAATTESVQKVAQQILEERLGATNATRPTIAPIENPEDFHFRIEGTPTRDTTEGSIAQQPQKRQVGHRVLEGKGPTERQVYPPPGAEETSTGFVDVNNGDPNAPGNHRSPIYRLTEDSRPGSVVKSDSAAGGGVLLTKDVGTASAHLANLNTIIRSDEFAAMSPAEQAGYKAQRDGMQQQISDYYRHQKAIQGSAPTIGPPSQVQSAFKPVDIRSAIDSTGDFSEAAKQLDDAAKPVYDHANAASGGDWQTLKDHIIDLKEKLANTANVPSNAASRHDLAARIGEAEDAMKSILDDPRAGFEQADTDQARQNFRAASVLRDAHEAIKPIYALEHQPGLITGRYRGMDGQMLATRWKEFIDAHPDARNIIGSDRVDSLARIFKANDTMAARKRFGNALATVASSIAGAATGSHFGAAGAGEGAAVGPIAYQSMRYALQGLIANPKAAKSLLFAIDSGARPEYYGPAIAKLITASRGVGAGAAARATTGGQ